MNEKMNLNWCMESIEKRAFERGKKVERNEFNKILDKIRAEIEELKPNNPNFKGYFEQNIALDKAIEIIDKYKGKK